MANTYTTSDLVDDILLLGHVPTGNNTFTTAKLLRLADMELQTPITKQILSTRGGYYRTYTDYPANDTGLYVIPSDAIAGVLDNIEIVDGTSIIQVNLLDESEQYDTQSPTSTSYGAFLKGNFVQILPFASGSTALIRMWFFKRTSTLIATSSASQIISIASNVYTVSSIPSTILNGSFCDMIGDQPPFNILSDNQEITAITSTDITFAEPVVGATVGDWIALHNQTPVPQIPVEFRVLLAQRVVCKVYELQGYLDKLGAAEKKLEQYEAATFSLITPRIKSQTKIVNPVNGGFMSANRNRITNFPASNN